MVRIASLRCNQLAREGEEGEGEEGEGDYISCRAHVVALKGSIRSREHLLSCVRTIAGCTVKMALPRYL